MLKRRDATTTSQAGPPRAEGEAAPSSRRDRFAGPPPGDPQCQTELTFIVEPAAFKALGAHPLLGGPARLRWGAQSSVCFDTEAGDLHRSGLLLQMRRARARNVMSLTTDEGPVEVTAPGDAPQIELLPPAARGLVARLTAQQSLRPWFSWRIRRATRRVAYEGATIEVAFEEGEIAAEAGKAPIREISLRLKEGEPASLYRLGLQLADVCPLRLNVASRFDRGQALAKPAAAARARAPAFGADATLDAAIGDLLRRNLAHFLGNWLAVESGDSGEGVHQLRVALRRLRSLLALLRRAFPAAEVDLLRSEAKRIADAFGDARDWRVFCEMVEDGPRRRLPQLSGLADLVALADARAEAGRAAGAAELATRATTRFVLALQVYICTRGWRNAAGEPQLRALGEPAAAFAAEALERSFRRLRKRARGFAALSPEARHEMRIALKRSRYAVDFFGSLFSPAEDVEAFSERASALQDLLGAANDAVVAGRLIECVDISADSALAFAAGAVVGWCERGGALDEATLRRGWRALRKARRFWRAALPHKHAANPGGAA
jgi:inorganic triphosphatase YgiF